MRFVLTLGGVLFLGGVVATCVFLAGVNEAAPIAFALGGSVVAIAAPVGLNRLGNWGVPGDEPPLAWPWRHRG